MTNPETALLDNEYFTSGEQTFIFTDVIQDVSAIRAYILGNVKSDFTIFASAISSALEKLLAGFDNVSLSYDQPVLSDLEAADKVVLATVANNSFSRIESESHRLRIPTVYILNENALHFAVAA